LSWERYRHAREPRLSLGLIAVVAAVIIIIIITVIGSVTVVVMMIAMLGRVIAFVIPPIPARIMRGRVVRSAIVGPVILP
jgi:hypothetical protein